MYTKIHAIKKTVSKAINYTIKDEKTDNGKYIYCNSSGVQFANKSWESTRKKFQKNSGNLAFHCIQSFDPKLKVSADEAHKVGIEFAKRAFGKLGFDFIVTTHIDTGVIHNHIHFNSVSKFSGNKYYDNEKSKYRMRKLSVDVAREFGIDEINTYNKYSKSSGIHYTQTGAYLKWSEDVLNNRNKIRKDINSVINDSVSYDDFILKMKELGYSIKDKASNGTDLKYISFKGVGAERYRRDRTLGTAYTRTAIKDRIERNINKNNIKNNYQKKYYINSKPKKRTKYIINPRWDIINNSLTGKVKYRRRSYTEEILIKAFLKENNKIKNNNQSNYYTQRIKNEAQKYIARIKFMRDNNVYSIEDSQKSRIRLSEQSSWIDNNFSLINEKILEFENMIKHIEMKIVNEQVYEEMKLYKGKELDTYKFKNKNAIENYAIGERFVRNNNIDENRFDEYKEKLILYNQKVNELIMKKKEIDKKINEYQNFENNMREVLNKNQEKER